MTSFWGVALAANYVLVPFIIASVLLRRREPQAMLGWILAIVFLPFLGMFCYWLMGSNRIVRRTHRRRRRLAHLIEQLETWTRARHPAESGAPAAGLPADLRGIADLSQRLTQIPAIGGNVVEVYEEANATFAALDEAIRGARRHIHLEYYIWQPDETGYAFRDLIIEKARAGVECRLLLDSVGCWRLGRRFLQPLRQAGVQVSFFLPLLRVRKRFTPHLRNHRKIAVIDGQVAFLGSQNIGDEYRGRRRRLSPWYDAHLRIDGPAALFVQRTFVEDWLFATRRSIGGPAYFAEPRQPGHSIVQILPTGPDQNVSPLEHVVFGAVAAARRSIRIATPYFVPDPGLRMALLHAASRGVQVELVLPTRSDSVIVLWAGRSFYPELLEAGVRIFEYDHGVLHSKIVTVDDRWCMLGSANMDTRSFRLNFEITALLYDVPLAARLGASVERFCRAGRPVHLREIRHGGLARRLGEGAARLLAPLL